MSATENATKDESTSMVYRLMSQGVSVAVAKTLLSMESRYDKAMANMEKKWEVKLFDTASDAKAEVWALKTELEGTKKALSDIRTECLEWKSLYQQKCESSKQATDVVLLVEEIHDDFNTKLLSLSSTVKILLGRVVDHESILKSFQRNEDDFHRQYIDRNKTIDSLFLKTRSDIEGIVNAVEVIDKNNKILTQDYEVMKQVCYHNIDAVQAKVEHMSTKTALCVDTHVSIDEHNQLRSYLEDQILECNIKIDHSFLTLQQQYDETNCRCDELKLISEVSTGYANQQDESSGDRNKSKEKDLPQIDTRSIAFDSMDGQKNRITDIRKNLFDDTSTVGLEESFLEEVDSVDEKEYITQSETFSTQSKEKVVYVMHNEFDDEDSVFGGSANLVFLSELNIQA
jgi:hypothetical protein